MLTNDEKAELAGRLRNFFAIWRNSKVSPQAAVAYVEDVADYSIEAIDAAMRYFRAGPEDRNNAFPPEPPEFVAAVRRFHRPHVPEIGHVIAVPIGQEYPEHYVPLGPTSVDFGHGRIALEGKSHEEKEAILASGGAPPANKKLPRTVLAPMVKRITA